MRFVLASASPARLATLRAAGVEPEVIVSHVDETGFAEDRVADLVLVLAQAKGESVASRLSGDAVVLACDSLLDLDGTPLGKPQDADDARRRWLTMRGRSGVLCTGHSLLRLRDGVIVDRKDEVATTTVWFADVTDAEIDTYISTGEPLHVAGAFTVDGLAGWFVERVEGDHHNVVGVSLPLVRRMLAELGLQLTDIGYAS